MEFNAIENFTKVNINKYGKWKWNNFHRQCCFNIVDHMNAAYETQTDRRIHHLAYKPFITSLFTR